MDTWNYYKMDGQWHYIEPKYISTTNRDSIANWNGKQGNIELSKTGLSKFIMKVDDWNM